MSKRRKVRAKARGKGPKDDLFTGEAKQKLYREPLWAAIDARCPEAIEDRRVLILESGAGLEAKYLQELGYVPKNITACNKSAQTLAHVTMNLHKFGKTAVNTEKGEFMAVALLTRPAFHVVSYDGCAVLSDINSVRIEALYKCLPVGTVFTVTVTGARDGFNGEDREAWLRICLGDGAEVDITTYSHHHCALMWAITTVRR